MNQPLQVSDGRPPRLRVSGVTKTFPGVVANRDVSFEVMHGEIFALLGENGAGKSTIMKVVSGMLTPDSGTIEIDGRPVQFRTPADARAAGIGMVYQHFALAPTLTVAENLALSAPTRLGVVADVASVARRVRELSSAYHLYVDPDAIVGQLSVGARQRVEIVKLLLQDASTLIFDEPSAVLTPLEWEHLARILLHLAAEGHSIVLITHKLDEIYSVATRCTVLRHGEVAGTVSVAETSKADLARLIVNRDTHDDLPQRGASFGDVVLAAENLRAASGGGLVAVDGVSFELHAGEILGVAGVDGNGQSELAEVLTGLRPALSGSVSIDGTPRLPITPLEYYQLGGAYVPEDRHHWALASDLSVRENLIMKELQLGRLQRRRLIDHRAGAEFATRLVEDFGIKTPSLEAKAGSLSGGNQQKVVLARELSREPRLLIVAQATRGLDLGATEEVLTRVQAAAARGCAVLFISTELEEIRTLSDRIAVMVRGQFSDVLDRREATNARLGLLLSGEGVEAEDEAALLTHAAAQKRGLL